MNKHVVWGIVCGAVFAAVITWVAAFESFAEGGFMLLATTVAGLAAGLCIGALIAANFAMLAVEEKHEKEAAAERRADLRAAA